MGAPPVLFGGLVMSKTLKKVLAIVLATLMVMVVFAACSSDSETEEDATEETTLSVTTDDAVVCGSDASALIKTYTAEELGIEGDLDDYTILVANNGVEIDGSYYINVSIANKIDNGDDTYSFDSVGEFYISYDATEILSYDSETDTYTALEDVHTMDDVETTIISEEEEEAHED